VASSSETSVVALRIGYFAGSPPVGPGASARARAAWLSPQDCAELVRAAVEAEDISWAVANGISANRYRHADLSETALLLGYRPVDDAWAAG
jgi:uronate dehydrogenase